MPDAKTNTTTATVPKTNPEATAKDVAAKKTQQTSSEATVKDTAAKKTPQTNSETTAKDVAAKNANEKIGEMPGEINKKEGNNGGAAPTVLLDPPKTASNNKQTPGGLFDGPFVPIILVFVVMIFLMHRANKKQTQKRQEMIDKLTKGSKVLLSSGIYGTVDAVHEDSLIVEIATGVKVKVAKSSVAGIDAPEAEGKAEGK